MKLTREEKERELLEIAFKDSTPSKITFHLCQDNIKVDMIVPISIIERLNCIDGGMEEFMSLLSNYFGTIYLGSIDSRALSVLAEASSYFHKLIVELSLKNMLRGSYGDSYEA